MSIYQTSKPRKSKDQTLLIGGIGNPCSMDHPKPTNHELFGRLDFQGILQKDLPSGKLT